jgi:hypothetical protein
MQFTNDRDAVAAAIGYRETGCPWLPLDAALAAGDPVRARHLRVIAALRRDGDREGLAEAVADFEAFNAIRELVAVAASLN